MKLRILANLKIHRQYDVELALCKHGDGVNYRVEYGNDIQWFTNEDKAREYWKRCADHAMHCAWSD